MLTPYNSGMVGEPERMCVSPPIIALGRAATAAYQQSLDTIMYTMSNLVLPGHRITNTRHTPIPVDLQCLLLGIYAAPIEVPRRTV